MNWDEIEVCFICEQNHDCSQGSEMPKLDNEWVCLGCQEKNEKLKEE